MVNELFYAYQVLHVSFFIYTAFFLAKFSSDIVNKEEYIVFRLLLVSYMVYVMLNAHWMACEFGLLKLPQEVLYFMYEMTTIGVSTVCFMIFMFIFLRLAPRAAHKPYMRWLSPLPYVLVVLLTASNYWTKFLYIIDASQHLQYQPDYLVVPGVTVAYFVAVMVIAAIKYVQTKIVSRRRTYRLMIISMIFVFLCIYTDGMFRYLSILPIAGFGAILFIFINIQEAGINSDKLTGMNNRRKADEYLSERMRMVTPEKPMFLYMLDINRFKQINDRYGHAEGDDALMMTASAIKRAVSKYTGFAARYGGDEFIIAWMPGTENPDPNAIPDEISSALKTFCTEQNKPYELTISWGVAVCRDPAVSAQTYLGEADEALYNMKRKYGRRR